MDPYQEVHVALVLIKGSAGIRLPQKGTYQRGPKGRGLSMRPLWEAGIIPAAPSRERDIHTAPTGGGGIPGSPTARGVSTRLPRKRGDPRGPQPKPSLAPPPAAFRQDGGRAAADAPDADP